MRRDGLMPASFRLAAGDRVSLVGPSGSGKTLLLRSLADLDPHDGTMILDGTTSEATPAPLWRRRVGLLPADSAWWDERVGGNLPPGSADWLAPLGLAADIIDWPVSRLSSGERQRLALARLLTLGPDVLLLDEPTAHLDADNQHRVENLLLDHVKTHAIAWLWVSHDPTQATRIGNRHWRMAGGRLIVE